MTTAKQYSQIDKVVYDIDRVKRGQEAFREGYTFFEEFPENKGVQFQVLKTVDTNDPQNSHGYDVNGFQGMASLQ